VLGTPDLPARLQIDDHEHQFAIACRQHVLGVHHTVVHAGHDAQKNTIVHPLEHGAAVVVLRDGNAQEQRQEPRHHGERTCIKRRDMRVLDGRLSGELFMTAV
jgi:hypothetical protein